MTAQDWMNESGNHPTNALKAPLLATEYRERAEWLASECARLETERDEAREFGEKAAKLYNDSLTLTCAFCGVAYKEGTPASRHDDLTAHVKVCDKHPMRDGEKRRERLEAALRKYGRHLSDTDVGRQNECAKYVHDDTSSHGSTQFIKELPCTCGLDAALEAKP